jgi:hypothetical protein
MPGGAIRGGGLDLREAGLAMLTESPLAAILSDLNGGFERLGQRGTWTCAPTFLPAAELLPEGQLPEGQPLTPVAAFSRGLHIDGRRPVGSLPGEPGFASFVDLEERVSVKPFQNFVFVSCNDQTQLGCGQTYLPGMLTQGGQGGRPALGLTIP